VRDPDHVVAASYAWMITLNRTSIDYLSPLYAKAVQFCSRNLFFCGRAGDAVDHVECGRSGIGQDRGYVQVLPVWPRLTLRSTGCSS
jgi:hypothetical protein